MLKNSSHAHTHTSIVVNDIASGTKLKYKYEGEDDKALRRAASLVIVLDEVDGEGLLRRM